MYQIAKSATTDVNGNPLIIKDHGEAIKGWTLKVPITCKCGFSGELWQMMGTDDSDMLYCPKCSKPDNWRYN